MSEIKFYMYHVSRVELGQFLNSLYELRQKHREAGRSTFIEWVELAGDNYTVAGYFAVKSNMMAVDLAKKMATWWPTWNPIESKQVCCDKTWPSYWIEKTQL